MLISVEQEYRKAFALVEQWRYRFDVEKTVKMFVNHWAYLCTGLYKPTDKDLDLAEYEQVAKPLTHILSNLMLHGVSDPLATILSEFCKGDAKHQGYFPTPPEVGNLISALLGTNTTENDSLHIYEPACGSAGIIMQKIERLFEQRSEFEKPLGNVTIVVEDISATAIHAFCIQLIFKIKYLSLVSGKQAEPFSVDINQIDVLTRKQGSVRYLFTHHR